MDIAQCYLLYVQIHIHDIFCMVLVLTSNKTTKKNIFYSIDEQTNTQHRKNHGCVLNEIDPYQIGNCVSGERWEYYGKNIKKFYVTNKYFHDECS